MKNRYVYFIKERIGDLAPVKIGYAKNVQKRLDELQIGNSRSLEILAVIGPISHERARNIESKLHRKFKKHHVRGEWFSGVVLKNMHWIQEEVIDYRKEIENGNKRRVID